ncbi:hypothetical protein COP1_037873 [Malus domestica]
MPAQTSVTNQNRPTEKAGLQALRAAEHQSQKHPHPQLPIGFWVFPTSSGDSLTEPTRIPVTHPQPGDAVERPVRQVGVIAVIGKFFVGGGQGDCGEKILLAPVAEGYCLCFRSLHREFLGRLLDQMTSREKERA